ncbi:MAG TPA: hypothetical protein PK079_18820 [Leptospiraceae bacterium]|nr:hypothetical protein [Leptospiraceae bacterium]HMX31100.1 hypothetical protein [Leptospiraceae bacterium]HMY31916.1 hypothetical protein [Leptospiraceae bacterium]HMZ65385.1 hypothetical protein [Leptospiraceae bacterium]HNA06269.1 hypothetical protein [Leptospiraceae bacterium]
MKWMFVFMISLPIWAEYTIDVISAYKKTTEEKVEQNKTTVIENKYSDNIIQLNTNMDGKRNLLEYKIQLSINKRSKDNDFKDILYLGDNCYLLLPIKKFQLVLGRSLFPESLYLKKQWKDGMEGFGLKAQISDQFFLQVYLVDFYRGFPLFEKYFLYKNFSEVNQKGERFRHGLTFVYRKETLFSKIQFTYLNLGNWGDGTKDDLKAQPKGDSDFIYKTTFHISERLKYFTIGFELQIARGIDKVQYNPNRKEKSIPISGELICFYFESYWKNLKTNFEVFLPDSDKRNKQGEVLESGFVGEGTHPTNALLLNQELNFYPSGWITPLGLQKVNSYREGRMNSLWIHIGSSLRLDDLHFGLELDHLTPRLSSGASNGGISFQRGDYSNNYLAEVTAFLLYDKRLTDGYFIKVNTSKLTTSKEIGLEGTSAYIQGGILF